MDYNQEQFIRAQFETPKMPFYMSYPMQNMYLTEMEYEKDMERMKELYPYSVKQILDHVEEECDKMEYEGSLMFDEYPDRLMMEQIIDKIYEKVAENGAEIEVLQYRAGAMPPPPKRGGRPQREDALWNLIGVVLNNEMYRRRCRHRRCRRWW